MSSLITEPLARRADGYLVRNQGRTLLATADDWTGLDPVLRVGGLAITTTSLTATDATWTLSAAQVAAIVATAESARTSSARYRVTVGAGDALREFVAGTLAIVDEGTPGVGSMIAPLSVVVGPPGKSIESLEIDEDGHLQATLSGGQVIDGGPVPIPAELVQASEDAVTAAGVATDRAAAAEAARAAAVVAQGAAEAAAAPAALDATVAGAVTTPGSLTNAALSSTYAPGAVVPPPAGFALPTLGDLRVTRLGGGRFATNIESLIATLRPAAGVTYYAAPAGSAGADGLSAATPTTITAAMAKPDIGTLILAPGEYFRSVHTTTTLTKNLNVLASGPGVIVTSWNEIDALTWTSYSGAIYQTSRSGTVGVVDVVNRSAWGDPTLYIQRASAAEITAAGEWALVGSTLYVWAIGGTDLSVSANRAQIRVGVVAKNGFCAGAGATLYIDGVEIEGAYANAGIAALAGGTVIAVDCKSRCKSYDNGFQILGGRAIFVRCEASSAALDGFNYHAYSGVEAEFIEVDCSSHHNGLTASVDSCNASTSHEYARGVRIGGSYYSTKGPVVADVNGARTWNLGCTAEDSKPASGTNKASWLVQSAYAPPTNAAIWLDECTAGAGSNYDLVASDAGGNPALNVRSLTRGRGGRLVTIGTVTYY